MFKIISTLFYVGLLPRFQASIASLIGFALFYFLKGYLGNTYLFFSFYFIIFSGSILSVYLYQKASGAKDPKEIVADEFLAAALIPLIIGNFYWGLGSLLLYRVLDILKPGVLRKIDQMNHWSAIFIDDFAAVILAIIPVKILVFVVEG